MSARRLVFGALPLIVLLFFASKVFSSAPIKVSPGTEWVAPSDMWVVVGDIKINNSSIYSDAPYRGNVTIVLAGTAVTAEWGATAYPPFWASPADFAEKEQTSGCSREDKGCDAVWIHTVKEDGSFTSEPYSTREVGYLGQSSTRSNEPTPCTNRDSEWLQPIKLGFGESWKVPEDCWIAVGSIEVNTKAVYSASVSSGDITRLREGNELFAKWGATIYPPGWAALDALAQSELEQGCIDPLTNIQGCNEVILHFVESNGAIVNKEYYKR